MTIKTSEIGVKCYSFSPCKPDPKGLIGFAIIEYGELELSGIGIYTRLDGNGIRCVFPTRHLPNGFKAFLIRPISREATKAITKAVEFKVQDVCKTYKGSNNEQFSPK